MPVNSILSSMFLKISCNLRNLLFIPLFTAFLSCSGPNIEGSWDFEFSIEDEPISGVLKLIYQDGTYQGHINSFQFGNIELQNLIVSDNELSADFEKWGLQMLLKGSFGNTGFNGSLEFEDEVLPFKAKKQPNDLVKIDRSQVKYLLTDNAVREKESNIDHAAIFEEL
ncbi:MAG: hypothetical protein RIM68_14295, partial [Arenibacter sp.]